VSGCCCGCEGQGPPLPPHRAGAPAVPTHRMRAGCAARQYYPNQLELGHRLVPPVALVVAEAPASQQLRLTPASLAPGAAPAAATA
jgi:hypothetical protein